MKRNSTFISISLLVFLVGLSLLSCKTKKEENHIEFDHLKLDEKVFLLPQNDTTLPFADVKIDFIYPKKFNNQEDLSRLQQIFTGTFFNDETYDSLSPQEALNNYVENYTKEYRELTNQYNQDLANLEGDNRPSWYWYMLQKNNEIVYNDKHILSYLVEHADYTGGAHGSLQVLYYTIDLNELTTITEEDIFQPNYQHELTSKIIEKLMNKYDVDTPEKLIDEGFFDINEIAPNNNFWLNDNGIHYIFNQYEIAPYSMGPIEVTIPYEEIKSIMIPESVAKNYME